MKRILLAILGFMALLTSQETFAQIGMGTETPDKSAVLDLVSTRRGLLIPRFDIPNLSEAAPVTDPVNSLLVYNLGTTTPAEEGFYYWDDVAKKWVAITTGSNQLTYTVSEGDGVTVTPATTENNTDYQVKITPGTAGQYLVTYEDNGDLKTKWIDLPDLLADLAATNGLNYDVDGVTGKHTLKLGGPLTGATTITTDGTNTLAIAGLQEGANTDKIVVMGVDGILKKISRETMLDSKTLTTDGKIVVGDNESSITTLADAVLVQTSLSIKKESIGTTELADNAVTTAKIDNLAVTEEKLAANAVTAAKLGAATNGDDEGKVPVADADGNVTYQNISEQLGADLKIETDVLEFLNNTDGEKALLVETELGIKDGGITEAKLAPDAVTETKIKNGAVTAEKLNAGSNNAGKVPVANVDGTVTYQNLNTNLGKKLESNGSITISNTDNKALLENLSISITPGDENQVLVTNGTNGTEWTDINSLVEVKAANGLHMEEDEVYLGGALKEPTAIETDGTNTLAIEGLQTASAANQILVAEIGDSSNDNEGEGVLRTVARSLSATLTATENIANITGYSIYTQEVNINVDVNSLGSNDIDLTLPDAVTAVGQVINIKLIDPQSKGEADKYLNIKSGTATITYGALPYQAWVLKSNGSSWYIASRY